MKHKDVWEALKRRCCSTREFNAKGKKNPDWDNVKTIVLVREHDIKAIVKELRKAPIV